MPRLNASEQGDGENLWQPAVRWYTDKVLSLDTWWKIGLQIEFSNSSECHRKK